MRTFIQRLSDRGEFFVVVALSFSYIITTSLVVLLLNVRRWDLTTSRVLSGLLFELLTIIAVAAILRIRGWGPVDLGLRFSWPAALAGVPLCALYLTLYSLAVAGAVALLGSSKGLKFSVVRTAPLALLLVFVVVNSFFEEIAVSGYVIEALSSRGAALAITASTLIRFAYHLYQGPVASLSILPLGLLFGAVYWRWRTLWPLIVAHTMVNVLSLIMAA